MSTDPSAENTHQVTNQSSPRSFGLLFAAIFAGFGLWPWLFSDRGAVWWLLAVAAILLLIALLLPALLTPLNNLWFKFGMLLGKIMNPVIMGLIFLIAVLPIGMYMRARGKRPLQLEFPRKEDSLWHTVPDEKRSFRNQF